ncbi:MAG: hypothetical protein MZV64_69070 [Ignavibacteriales bacterium]|nr:hypothetical protein [Ignavibacteriales bacterium]
MLKARQKPMSGSEIIKILGLYIKNYQDKSGVNHQSKIFNLIFLWTMILTSAFLLTRSFPIKILLLADRHRCNDSFANDKDKKDLTVN